jgi:hypothetical protein
VQPLPLKVTASGPWDAEEHIVTMSDGDIPLETCFEDYKTAERELLHWGC